MSHTILIADDSPFIREALCKFFEQDDFNVCGEAENGKEADDQAQELHPDLILLDLSMPVMNGLEQQVQINLEKGMSMDDPRRQASRALGGVTQIEQQSATRAATTLSKMPSRTCATDSVNCSAARDFLFSPFSA